MRPTLTEQLAGLSRILSEVVRPELADPYPKDILDGVCATLEAIAAGWSAVPEFLDWDARRSGEVMERALSADPQAFGADVAAHIRGAIAELAEAARGTDVAALADRQRRARRALEMAAGPIAGSEALADVRSELTALMRERAVRYPVQPVWHPAPSPAS